MALKQLPIKSGISREDARSSKCGPRDPEELEKLESVVKQVAQKILEYRSTLPDQLNSTVASFLVTQRPLVPEHSDATGHSGAPTTGASEQEVSIGGKVFKLDDPETAKKVRLFNEKSSSNASAMPVVLKRMKDCIARIDNLGSYNVIIHPAFKSKRTK